MNRTRIRCVIGITVMLTFAVSALSHVRVTPNQSAPGATQRYTVRVPTEKQSPTVRIEIDFPNPVNVTSVETSPGWVVEQKKDGQGRIAGAVWSGGSIPFAEYREFYFNAVNPASEMKLEWKAIQIYEDGTRSEWTGPEGSRSPVPVTTVKTAQ